MKKKLLVVYDAMITGGTTTAIIPFLKLISSVYDVDLLLYKNDGEHMDDLTDLVTLLPEARIAKRDVSVWNIIMMIIATVKSAIRFLIFSNKKDLVDLKKYVLSEVSLVGLSRKVEKQYDVAMGFIEGWADKYVATRVKASKKISWIHAQIDYVAPQPKLDYNWMKHIDKFIFVTESNKDRFDILFPGYNRKSGVCENIIDADCICSKSQIVPDDESYSFFAGFTGLKIITVCRLTENIKGIDRIVRFAKTLKANGISFRWCILGDGKDRSSICKQIEENCIEDCLFLLGNISNPFPYVKAADVFVLLSRFEGKPICITESLIIGTPTIVTNYPSANEQINNGFNGIIIDNSDFAIIRFSEEFAAGKHDIKVLKFNLSNKPFEINDPISNILKVIED